ncbi:MAG: hypothetical protein RL318_517 [Fibrobacterota bacterium]|jgi:hypothetical protein
MKRLLGLSVLPLLFWGCGQNDSLLAGGSSSEVPNALTGTASDPSGWPVAGAQVVLRPIDYQPGLAASFDSTTTDSNGRWSLPSKPGAWSLELHKGDDRWIAEVNNWEGNAGPRQDTLRQSGWISGRIGMASAIKKIWIAGTNHMASCDSHGNFLLGPVPPAPIRMVSLVDSAGTPLTSIHRITPRSGDTVKLGDIKVDSWSGEDYALWPKSRTAIVDISPTGAAGTGDHPHFPVLVRLDSVLDPAKVAREELRFDDGKGLHLPFEIETWDSSSHKAEVWVRLDTANGGSLKHLLRAFWGRKQPIPPGAPSMFGTQDAYLGVAHSLTSKTQAGMTFPNAKSSQGIVGNAIRFDGKASLKLGAISDRSDWTIGFWLRPTAKPSGEILLLGTESLLDSLRWGISLRDDLVVRIWSGASSDKELLSAAALPLDKWTWISASFDGTSSRLSLVVDSIALPRITVKMPAISSLPVTGMQGFVGDLDELRISATVRDRQWQQLERQTVHPGIPWIRWK